MSPSVLSEKSTTVRFKLPHQLRLPQQLLLGPLKWAPWLQRPVLSRLFFSPMRRRRGEVEEMGAVVGQIRVAGKQVRVRARGSGPPVLVVHGWQGSSVDLLAVAGHLVDTGFTVLSCDMPAHGTTEGTMTSVAEFIETIEKVGDLFGPFHGVVAHSLGGMAAAMAVVRGLPTNGVVLIAPMVSFDFALDEFAKILHLTDDMREVTARAAEQRVGFSRSEADLTTQDLPDVPVMMFHDRADRRTPYHHTLQLIERWPNVKFVSTDGLGHRRILLDEGVGAKIAAFVAGLPRTPANPLELGIVPELVDALC